MKLVVLGSGTSVPSAHRSSSAHWLETEHGSLLLDIGPDAPHRMAQEGLDWPSLDAIWISHFHLDHIGGLAPFIFGCRWAPQMKDRHKSLRIYGPQGMTQLIHKINDMNNYKLLEQTFPVELLEVEPGEEFDILPSLKAETLSTPHTPESLAIRLTENSGSTLVYTSDTGFSYKLMDFAKGVTLLLLECSFVRNKPVQTHLELSDAMLLARESHPQTVVLTHLYPEWDGNNISVEARKLWPGLVLEAVDGLRIDF